MNSIKLRIFSALVFVTTSILKVGASIEMDASFGSHGGYVKTNVSLVNDSDDYAETLTRLSDGKLLVAGKSDGNVVILRYTPEGILDETFANNGILDTGLKANEDLGTPLVLQNGLGFLTAGVESNQIIVARYSLSGTLDTSFANIGYYRAQLNAANTSANALVLDSTGNIVVIGEFSESGNSDLEGGLLIKLNPNGQIVTTFGSQGIAKFSVENRFSAFYCGTIQTDGKILTAGVYQGPSFNRLILVNRFNDDGSLDQSFAQSGYFVLSPNSASQDHVALAVREISGNKIVVAGYGNGSSEVGGLLLGLTNVGAVDSNFGENGIIFPDAFEQGTILSLNEERGHLILSGMNHSSSPSRAYVHRTSLSGVADLEFGNQGTFQLPLEIAHVGHGDIAYSLGAYYVSSGDKDTFGEVGDFTVSKLIDNNYVPEPTLVEFEIASITVDENIGQFGLSVKRTGNLEQQSSIDFAVINNSAVEGQDYSLPSGNIQFDRGEATKNLIVTIINDALVESNESFEISISNIVGGNVGNITKMAITIMDDDQSNGEEGSSSGGGGWSVVFCLLMLIGASMRERRN